MSMIGCRLYGQANGDLLQEDLRQHATPPRTAVACALDPTGDLPVGVWESPVKAWVSGGLLQGWGHGL